MFPHTAPNPRVVLAPTAPKIAKRASRRASIAKQVTDLRAPLDDFFSPTKKMGHLCQAPRGTANWLDKTAMGDVTPEEKLAITSKLLLSAPPGEMDVCLKGKLPPPCHQVAMGLRARRGLQRRERFSWRTVRLQRTYTRPSAGSGRAQPPHVTHRDAAPLAAMPDAAQTSRPFWTTTRCLRSTRRPFSASTTRSRCFPSMSRARTTRCC